MNSNKPVLFNSILETGVRSLAILTATFPKALDLQRLASMDYLVVHSRDFGGPESLHAPLPFRAGELLVRYKLIEDGLLLMMRKGLVEFSPMRDGFNYIASDTAGPFMVSMVSPYMVNLKECSSWLAEKYANTTTEDLRQTIGDFFRNKWEFELQALEEHGND